MLDFLIFSPLLLLFFNLLFFIISREIIGLYIFFAMMLTFIIVISIKLIITKFFDNLYFKEYLLRPHIPSFGCCNYKNKNNKNVVGFPSGHSSLSFVFTIFWTLYILFTFDFSFTTLLCIFLLFLLPVSIGYSRIYIGCHNFLQVMFGFILGFIIGIPSFIIYYFFHENKDLHDLINPLIFTSIELLICISIVGIINLIKNKTYYIE